MKHFFKLIVLALFLSSSTFAQVGLLKGTILDSKSKEPMIGATIMVVQTQGGTTTDIDGNFELEIAAGLYNLNISSVGFTPIILENVRVEAGKTTMINTSMDEASIMLEGVEIKAQRKTGSEISVVSEIKQLQNIVVGVSSQQITRTQDRDASQVVRRVPGVSIFDDRFIIIRGLNERYNSVLLNDIITPSTEVDVKSFSFDLIPSSALDRLMLYKSPAADLPGDIAGGAIKIYTKTVPDDDRISISFGAGYRNGTTNRNVTDHRGTGLDVLGLGNSYRALPSTFPTTRSVVRNASSEAMINNFRGLNPYYDVYNKTVLPDLRGNISLSKRFFMGSKELTNISYINYSNTNQFQNFVQNRFLFDGSESTTFNDQNFANNVRLGLMSNWALIINPRNKIEFRNLFNQIASKETVVRSGSQFENDLEIANQSYRYEQRSILSSQLSGTHELDKDSKFVWIGGFGYTSRYEPDFRRFTSSRKLGSDEKFRVNLQQFESPTLQQAARFNSKMDEYIVSGSAAYEKVIGNNNENKELNKLFKTGVYSEYKDRYFAARWFGIVNPNRVDQSLLSQDFAAFFSLDNLRSSRFFYTEGTNFDDKYTSQNLLNAAYASMYLPIKESLFVTLGLRAEYNIQQLQSRERGGGQAIDVNNPVLSPLPSVNANYKFNENNILRFGYGITINRPEFRELAPFTYYDFNFDVARRGNKDIKVATIQNVDLRYDFYPSKSELITVGAFYKKFKNPIEAAIFYNGSTVAFTVTNSESATSQGIELEVRKNLTDKIQLYANGSLISSNVVVSGLSDQNRFLQGQSPYLVNTGVFYNDPENKLQANILFNVVGKRIYVIGDNVISANVYEMPRNVIDLNITKTFGRTEFKIGVQDLLNQSFRLIQDTNRDKKITDADGIFQQSKRGTNIFATIGYQF